MIEKKIDKILQLSYFNDSLLCTKIISLEDNDTGNLETAISTDQFNNLPCKTSYPGNEEKGLRFRHCASFICRSVGCRATCYPLVFLLFYPQTWWHLSGVWHSPHQTKHKDLLLYCYSTVKDSWLHPHSPQTHTWRDGKVFPLWVSLEGWTPGFKEALLGIYPQ